MVQSLGFENKILNQFKTFNHWKSLSTEKSIQKLLNAWNLSISIQFCTWAGDAWKHKIKAIITSLLEVYPGSGPYRVHMHKQRIHLMGVNMQITSIYQEYKKYLCTEKNFKLYQTCTETWVVQCWNAACRIYKVYLATVRNPVWNQISRKCWSFQKKSIFIKLCGQTLKIHRRLCYKSCFY